MTRHCCRALILAALISGCSWVKPDTQVDAFGRRLIRLLESGDSAAIVASVDPSLTSYTVWGNIAALRDTLRSFHRDSTSIVGWNVLKTSDTYRAQLTYELHGQGWALITIPIVRRQGSLVAADVRFERLNTSLAEASAFRLAGRSPRHYFVLAAAITSLLISFGAAITVVRTPMPRRWLWAFIALVGYGQYTINWSTGETAIQLLRVQLFGAGFLRSGFAAPWLISFALPLGAAFALRRRRRFLASASVPAVASTAA